MCRDGGARQTPPPARFGAGACTAVRRAPWLLWGCCLALTVPGCGDDDAGGPPVGTVALGPQATFVIEAPGQKPLEVTGPRARELPPDRTESGGEVWLLPTLYGRRVAEAGAVLEAECRGSGSVKFEAPGSKRGGSEIVLRRDPQGAWHVAWDPPLTEPGPEAHGVTKLRLHVPRNPDASGLHLGPRTGGGRGDGSGGGRGDGSGGGRRGREGGGGGR